MELENFEKGDKILFNDRAQPLEIEKVNEESLLISGPKGGEYEVYLDGDTLLVCKKGSRHYSTYCENIRKVGEWIKDGDEWTHSISDAKVWIEEDENGFWRVESDTFEVENPKYGFSSKEFAEEEAEKILESNPDGRY